MNPQPQQSLSNDNDPAITEDPATTELDFDPVAIVRQIKREQGGLARRQGLGG